MSVQPTSWQLEAFQQRLSALLGLRSDDNRPSLLAEVLTRRATELGVPIDSYLQRLSAAGDHSSETSELARELTVGETYFFRHADQFRAFEEVALPERLSARAHSRQLHLLSAGCASGEEPYSLSITLRERGVEPAFAASVWGIDLNPEALRKAERGVYGTWSLRETPKSLQERWFEKQGRDFHLARAIRDAVRFAPYNLCGAAAPPLPSASFDVIFCRNVLMYFTPEHAAQAVAQLARLLCPGGFLFLGHAETLRGLSHAFQLRHTHDTFYYQLKAGAEHTLDHATTAHAIAPRRHEPGHDREWVSSWLDTVERSTEKIRQLSTPQGKEPVVEPRPSEPRPRDLSRPLRLLRDDRFAEALDTLQRPDSDDDPATLLLRAALLSHQGDFAEAQRACHDVLRRDDLNAGAHYLLALCCERQGNTEQAMEHDRTAIYLDAGFAMPHLHLGLMARRRSDAAAARDELEKALRLLEREEEARLLLFGGGFSRAALVALCRAELSNLKVRP